MLLLLLFELITDNGVSNGGSYLYHYVLNAICYFTIWTRFIVPADTSKPATLDPFPTAAYTSSKSERCSIVGFKLNVTYVCFRSFEYSTKKFCFGCFPNQPNVTLAYIKNCPRTLTVQPFYPFIEEMWFRLYQTCQ